MTSQLSDGMPPDFIAAYEVHERPFLGRGGFGQVIKVIHRGSKSAYAAKVL